MFGEIKNSLGERIDYTFHSAGQEQPRAIVVLGHGVTGNKDRPFLVALAEGLSGAGIPVLRISFSGNGGSGGRFVDSNVTKEVSDLGSVFDALGDRPIHYVGHSMGGAVGVLRASQDQRIRSLVSLAGMVHTGAFAQREFGGVQPGAGFMWDDETCPLSQSFMDDLAKIGSVAGRAPQIRVPWLLMHGTEDDVVPIQDSREIRARAGSNAVLEEIQGATHVFAGEATQPMVARVTAWMKEQTAKSC